MSRAPLRLSYEVRSLDNRPGTLRPLVFVAELGGIHPISGRLVTRHVDAVTRHVDAIDLVLVAAR